MGGANEKVSVEQLVENYRPRLKSFIRQWIHNKEDVEDILQDVFYQLLKTLGDNAVQITHLSAWMFRVTRNMIFNMMKKRREENFSVFGYDDEDDDVWEEFAETLFNDDNPAPDMVYLRSLVWSELKDALSELPQEQKDVFELTELEGMPVKVLSEVTGVPVATLLSRKHYAVKFLRFRLKLLYRELMEV